MPLGVLIDKNLSAVDRVFIPVFGPDDTYLIDYAQKLIYNNNSIICILDVNNMFKDNFIIESAISSLESKYPENIVLMSDRIMKKEFLSKLDLMIVSLESWKTLIDTQSTWLTNIPSVLIIKP